MASAQNRFGAMLREHVAPRLRVLGFQGSGQSYTLPDERCYALLGFQKSKANTADKVLFTVNLSVVNKAAWAESERPRTGTRPTANISYGDPVWWQRIGTFLPGNGDNWWTLADDSDVRSVAQEVLRAIEGAALPAMVAEMERQGEEPNRG